MPNLVLNLIQDLSISESPLTLSLSPVVRGEGDGPYVKEVNAFVLVF